jgi:hypothetical protein
MGPSNKIYDAWSYDPKGGLPKAKFDISPRGQMLSAMVNECTNSMGPGNYSTEPSSVERSATAPREFKSVCNIVVYAENEPDPQNAELTKGLTIAMADQAAMYKQLTQSNAQAEEQRKKAAEKAKANTPNL